MWAKAGTATAKMLPQIFLNDSVSSTPTNTSQIVIPNESIVNLTSDWQFLTFTYTIPTWSADLGSLANVNNLMIRMLCSPGDNTAQDIYVTGVQLEPGSVATPFEQRPIGTELALCQRYYQKLRLDGAIVCMGNDSNRTTRTARTLSVKMRSTPTTLNLVKDANAVITDQAGATEQLSAPSKVDPISDECVLINTLTKIGQLSTVRYNNVSVELDAEL
jgi:hypothetical protein